jgi:hypothetical protein
MSSIEEQCPICFDNIGEKNNIVTECGHKFHASCLMSNITHNGFACPCCRTLMATHTDDDDDTILDDESVSDDDDDDDDEEHEEYVLRGFRFFMNMLEGEENENADVITETAYNSVLALRNANSQEKPSLEFIVQALKEQGVTYEQLVANALVEYEEYEENESFETISDTLWGKLRTIISNYGHNSSLDELD